MLKHCLKWQTQLERRFFILLNLMTITEWPFSFCFPSSIGLLEETATCVIVNIARSLLLVRFVNIQVFPDQISSPLKVIRSFIIPVLYSVVTMVFGVVAVVPILLTEHPSLHGSPTHFDLRLAELGLYLLVIIIACSIMLILGVIMSVRRHRKQKKLFPYNNFFIGMMFSNFGLFALFLDNYDESPQNIFALLCAVIMGYLLNHTVQRYCTKKTDDDYVCSVLGLESALLGVPVVLTVVAYTSSNAYSYEKLGPALLFEALFFVAAWIVLILVYCLRKPQKMRPRGYWICSTIASILITVYAFLCIWFVGQRKGFRGKALGNIFVMAYLHIMAVLSLFHSEKTDANDTAGMECLHRLLHVLGTVGLTAVNAVTLITVIYHRARIGDRSVTDIRLIVMPFELVFLTLGFVTQMYYAWAQRMREGNAANGAQETPVIQPQHQSIVSEAVELHETQPLA